MKTQSEIEKRLQKLRSRYRRKYVQDRTGRRHQNCVHNYEHKPAGKFKYSKSHDVDLAPRKQTTLLVIQEDQPVRICMYGSHGKDWNGDICDADEKAAGCPWFKAKLSEDEVGAEFDELTSDVEWVFDNYRDMATLQWVLDVRSPDEVPDEPPQTLLGRVLGWFRQDLRLRTKPPQLPPPELEEPVTEPNPEIPKGLWDADSQDPRS